MHSLHRAALRSRIIDTIGDGGHSGRLLQILSHQLVTNVRRQAAQKQCQEEAVGPAILRQGRQHGIHKNQRPPVTQIWHIQEVKHKLPR
jgi:hypothetical protein